MSGQRPLKVAYVIDALFAPAGGTEGQLLHLLRGMDREKFEPTVFCLDFVGEGVDVAETVALNLHVSARPGLVPGILRFAERLRQGNFDIVQTHFRDSNIVGTLAARRAGIPILVSTRRGVPYWSTGTGLAFLRWLDRQATWFIANSRATRERYTRAEGIDPARFDVIYNGLEPDRFCGLNPADRNDLRSEFGVGPGAPLVGIVANLRRVKGLDDFLHAVALVSSEFGSARFVIVGQGDDQSRLRRLIDDLDLGEYVRMTGARPDVPDLLQAFDVGVLASHSESFSNSVLEYLAAGLPVVVTDVGGVREAVEDGRHGFIVPPKAPAQMADRLRMLLAHPGGPRAWRQDEGIDEKFHLRTMIRGHERLYERLASGRIERH